eukprot:CAMPEP_0170598930 /NCGR_PEP_ID=MMETSP0224-20130122/16516_1 /TAXON_ID=285029 /ORGANISM="Togula jolla, Strain CCCM 725" /LENGTH=901 /DNA_ID=CAMNT_0010923527 /DNA_START=113 /DNA_END=2818 /DNA_ORIENTATION=-
MTGHITVLVGNLQTSSGLHLMGKSSGGWSNVGLGLADSFEHELDLIMTNMTTQLTESLDQILTIKSLLDLVMSHVGDTTESLIQNANGQMLLEQARDIPPAFQKAADAIMNATQGGLPDALEKLVPQVMGEVVAILDKLLDLMEPTMLQVGKWYTSFGDKLQAGIEIFSTTVDLVQKMFDQIMSQSGGADDSYLPYMFTNTYTLFALTEKDKGITVQDLSDVSDMYQITALQGSKSEELHGKYDLNQDAFIDSTEYENFILDESMPYVMATVLRSYSKKLSQVGGLVARARMRDEVAGAVVKYLQLVCAKNITKVGWVSQRLTNGSLPMAFTADIMRNLALAQDDPEVLTTADVGATVIGVMAMMNHTATIAASELMADTDFWVSEGFDPADQPICVERVTRWIGMALDAEKSLSALQRLQQVFVSSDAQLSFLETMTGVSIETTAMSAREITERNRADYFSRKHQKGIDRYQTLRRTQASRDLADELLGGRLVFIDNPVASSTVNAGVPAVPATLEFAKFLSNNASRFSGEFLTASFNYSGQSSSALDAFATQIQGMIKKTQGFLSILDQYAGQDGMDKLRLKVDDFSTKAEEEIIAAIEDQFAKRVPGFTRTSLLQTNQAPGSSSQMTLQQMVATLDMLESVLPEAIANLKVARQEVATVSSTLDSVFTSFKESGLPLFVKLARIYSQVWVAWFILLTIFTLSILYYGFWASGYCGGPKQQEEREEYEPPTTIWERVKCCYGACCNCMSDWSETQCFFWSMILLGQIFVLLIFVVALVLCLLAGVKLFVSTNCEAVYMINDPTICTETLKMMQNFVETFDGGDVTTPLAKVCETSELLLCNIISQKMKMSAILTVSGGILVAVLSFQLLIESAILHERARMRRMIDGLVKEKKLKVPEA